MKIQFIGAAHEVTGSCTLLEALKLDSYTKTVNVTFRKATYAYSNLRLQLGSGTVSEPTSDVIYAKADVQNIGNEDGTAEAVLYINGAAVTSQKTALKAGETRTVEFAYKAPAGGSYTVKVGDIIEVTFGNRPVKIRVLSDVEQKGKDVAREMFEVIEG